MANRHLSRSVVLQPLFEWDFRRLPAEAAKTALARNAREFAPAAGYMPFMEDLMAGTIARTADLDLVIGKAAPEWPIERIAPIDRNLLRLGLYELLFADRAAVPSKGALHQATRAGQRFGGG